MKISYNLNDTTVYYICDDELINACETLNDGYEFVEDGIMPIFIDLNDEMPFYHDVVDVKDWPIDEDGNPSKTLLYNAGRPSYCKNLREEFYKHDDVPNYDITYDYVAHSMEVFKEFISGNRENLTPTNSIPVYELEIIYWHADYLGFTEFVDHVDDMYKNAQMHKTEGDWRKYLGLPDVFTLEEKNEIAVAMGWENFPEELGMISDLIVSDDTENINDILSKPNSVDLIDEHVSE